MNNILQQRIDDLPTNPGVYIMLDVGGNIIYIGKAKNLKNRVSQYFLPRKDHTKKVQTMVENIADFRYIIVDTELDALSLEAGLIGKHKPFFNILLKDDKRKPLIRIDLKKEYPRLEIVRGVKKDGAKYFGPYYDGVDIRKILDLCRAAFGIRTCPHHVWSKNHRPCLNYHLGLCSGACKQLISPSDYRSQIDKCMKFLGGQTTEVFALTKQKMKEASASLEYEKALLYRTRLQLLESLETRLVTDLAKDTDCDCLGFSTTETHACICIMNIRGGRLLASDNYLVSNIESASTCVEQFITQNYDGSRILPKEIFLPFELDNSENLEQFLKDKYNRATHLEVPKKGIKCTLVETANKNASDYATKAIDKQSRLIRRTIGACEDLKEILGLLTVPRRIECFDISHLSGTDIVASMSVSFDGEPDRNSYRRFKVKTVNGNNDFECMKEVLTRRLAHLADETDKFGARPDLILIDGGKGQLKFALDALSNIANIHQGNISKSTSDNAKIPTKNTSKSIEIPAKNTSNNTEIHAKNAINDTTISNENSAKLFTIPLIALAEQQEEIFLPGHSAPLFVPRDNLGLQLLQRTRDEAHRFAITFQRSLRTSNYISQLERIKGVGKERRILLLETFSTVENIKAATIEQIEQVDGIPHNLAVKIHDYFHSENTEISNVSNDTAEPSYYTNDTAEPSYYTNDTAEPSDFASNTSELNGVTNASDELSNATSEAEDEK